MDVADPDASVGPLLDILANKRRRIILRCFEHADSYSLHELAAHIVSVEQDIAIDTVSAQDRKAAYIACYQTHVPRCADANLLLYDSQAKTARKGPEYPNVKRVLECLDDLS